MRKHYVTFLSPGTFVSEQTTREIARWDPAVAAEMSCAIVERYNARPYAFYFSTMLSADPVPDGEGGTLRVEGKEVGRSGLHHLGGEIVTIEDVEARCDPKDSILLSNMRYTCPIVVDNRNSWRSTHPFEEQDVLIDASGKIVERGDTPERIAYRAKFAA